VKIRLFGGHGIPMGKHNVKGPRLDAAHLLVEAEKKSYAQVDVVGEDGALDANVILTTREGLPDVILKDLEFVETRLSRDPSDPEKIVLLKIQAQLESERCVVAAGLSMEELEAGGAHGFYTNKPVVVARTEGVRTPEAR